MGRHRSYPVSHRGEENYTVKTLSHHTVPKCLQQIYLVKYFIKNRISLFCSFLTRHMLNLQKEKSFHCFGMYGRILFTLFFYNLFIDLIIYFSGPAKFNVFSGFKRKTCQRTEKLKRVKFYESFMIPNLISGIKHTENICSLLSAYLSFLINLFITQKYTNDLETFMYACTYVFIYCRYIHTYVHIFAILSRFNEKRGRHTRAEKEIPI